jgi:hypothetical protein
MTSLYSPLITSASVVGVILLRSWCFLVTVGKTYPISYRPMLHSELSADRRHFRTKSKSWTAGEKRRFARKAMRF